MGRLKNKIVAALLTRFPGLFEKSVEKVGRMEVTGIPWAPFTRKLSESTLAIVTTAGVHLKGQRPFDMTDSNGDPSWRELPSDTPLDGYTITHDYYDHRDADRDLNIVFPITRLRELARDGFIGGVSPVNFGFMGHIDGPHVFTLINKTAPEVASRLKSLNIDAVILTPG